MEEREWEEENADDDDDDGDDDDDDDGSWAPMSIQTPHKQKQKQRQDNTSDEETSEIRVRSGGFKARINTYHNGNRNQHQEEEEDNETMEEDGAKTSGSGGVEFITHEVVETDTLVGLCVKYGVPQQDILRANGMGAFAGGAALLLRREIQVPTAPLPKGWSRAPRRKSDAERGGHAGGRHDTFNGDLLAKFASDAPLERSLQEERERELESIRNAALAAGALPVSTSSSSGGAAADVVMKDKAGAAGGGGSGAQELKRRSRLGGGGLGDTTSFLPESTPAGSLPPSSAVSPRHTASSAEISSDRSCFSLNPGHVVRVLAAKHQSFFGAFGGGGGNAASSSRPAARRTGASGAGPSSLAAGATVAGGGDGKRFAYVNRRHGSNGSLEMERLTPDTRANGGGGGVMRVPSVSKFVDKND